MNIEKNYIYVLYDPREPDNYRYIGFTNNITCRIKQHIKETLLYNKHPEWFKTYKINWINTLLNEKIKPVIKIIDEVLCDRKTIGEKEIYYCDKFLNEGHKLTNTADPGYGGLIRFINVYQYDLNGNFIKEYKSISEAIRETGITTINASINGRNKISGNYIWTKFKLNNIEIKNILKDIYECKLYPKTCKTIYQYDISGNFIKEYNSIKDASILCNLNDSNIVISCKNIKRQIKGYFFSYFKLSNVEIINRINIINNIKNKPKIINQYDLNGNFIKEYKSILYAAKYTNINKNGIVKSCNNLLENYKGFIWKYKENIS